MKLRLAHPAWSRNRRPTGRKKKPKGARRPRRLAAAERDHAPLRLMSSRREEGLYTSDASRTSLPPSCSIFSTVLCLTIRVFETSLSLPSFSPLFCTLALFSVSLFALPRIPFILSLRALFLRPSSHLSSRVPLRCSPAPSAPRWAASSSSLFGFSLLSSACLPSSGRTDRSCRARG